MTVVFVTLVSVAVVSVTVVAVVAIQVPQSTGHLLLTTIPVEGLLHKELDVGHSGGSGEPLHNA